MQTLDTLPDFGAPIDGGPTAIFMAYGGAPAALVLPDHLAIARLSTGQPDFQLTLTRASKATDEPWGSLRFRVEQRCPIDEALRAVRARVPGATVAAVRPGAGFARLVAAGSDAGLPAELSAPQPVDWTSGDALRFSLSNLSAASVSLLKGALLDSALLIWARLEIEVPGVSPRLPVRVSLSPKAVLNAVTGPAQGPSREVIWEDLVAGLSRGPGMLPIRVEGAITVDDHRKLGEALADRLRDAFGRFVPSLTGERPIIAFDDAALVDSVQWDLARPLIAKRPWAMSLDPIAAPRALAAEGRIADLIVERTAPSLQVGTWEIVVGANIPARRERVAAVGVTLRAPARPPERLQDVTQTLELRGSNKEASVRMQLAPREPLTYRYACYAILLGERGALRAISPERGHEGALLELSPADFPVDFIPVAATSELLAEASIDGALTYDAADGTSIEVPFALSQSLDSTSLPLPRDAKNASITLTATPRDGTAPLTLGPLPPAPLGLGPWSFSQYGPQRVSIDARFRGSDGLVAIDLLAEGQEESARSILTMHFTPAAPRREWTYFATSPFHAGYRYRRFVASGAPAPWSPAQSPSLPLLITDDEASSTPTGTSSFDIDGVHFYIDPASASTLRYIPAAPIPARGPNGAPLVSLIDVGALGAFLQMSTRFDLDDGESDRLRVALSVDHLDLAAASLQPAPITMDKVTVRLVPSDGADAIELGSSSGSRVSPWDAIFSFKLTPDQAARARSALAGRAGVLTVTAHLQLSREATNSFRDHPSTIERSADVASWLGADPPAPSTTYPH